MLVFARALLVLAVLAASAAAADPRSEPPPAAPSPDDAPPTAAPPLDPANDLSIIDLQRPQADIDREIVTRHPVAYLLYAQKLLEAGRDDDAVVWFYIGQLRYRLFLKASPPGDPTGDPALFGALMQTLGEPVNLHAGADPDKWARQIDEALAWDASHPNGFTSKTGHAAALAELRDGLAGLRDKIVAHKADILARRERNGIIPDRVVDGVLVREHRTRMPAHWPPLAAPAAAPDAAALVKDLAGIYVEDFEAMLGPIFFSDRKASAATLSQLELRPGGPDTLAVIGRQRSGDDFRKTITVRVVGDAAVFDHSVPVEGSDSTDGTDTEVIALRRNAANELVIERTHITKAVSAAMPCRCARSTPTGTAPAGCSSRHCDTAGVPRGWDADGRLTGDNRWGLSAGVATTRGEPTWPRRWFAAFTSITRSSATAGRSPP